MARGMKSFLGVCFVYDHALSWATNVVACVVIMKTCCTKFKWIKLVITISIKIENYLWWWQYPLVFVCGRGKGEKPIYVHGLHFPMWLLQQYFEAYHGLLHTHSCMGNITNGYPNHWWYDHIGIVKDAQL
jgi:hypothetical protein